MVVTACAVEKDSDSCNYWEKGAKMEERMLLCKDGEVTERAWTKAAEEDGRTGRQRCEGWDS